MIKKNIYNGYHFRSQTEARWAMIFDKLNIDYVYEPDCYVLQFKNKEINYLPDFYLTRLNRFIEVKNMGSQPPLLEECRKAMLLAQQNTFKAPVTILFGEIHKNQNLKHGSGRSYFFNGEIKFCDLLTQCPHCHLIDFCENGKLKHMTCACVQRYPEESNHTAEKIVKVLKEMRQYRFYK